MSSSKTTGQLAAVLICLLAVIPVQAGVTANLLRCESRSQPLGVDDKPRLSWVIESKERNQKQTVNRELVAASEIRWPMGAVTYGTAARWRAARRWELFTPANR